MSDPTAPHTDTNADNEPSDVTDEEESSLFDRAFDRVDALVGRSKGGAGGTFSQVPTLLVDEAS